MGDPRVDVTIVGGGPAGLSAALVLARSRRSVVICDNGRPRNAASGGVHGYLTRDGILPEEFLALGREEVARYGVELRSAMVVSACRDERGFAVTLEHGERIASRKLLLATGVVDEMPRIGGIDPFWGRSVFHCPYCDAWEVRDQPLAAYGPGRGGFGLALSLKTWSPDVALLTGGPSGLRREERAELERHAISLFEAPILRVEGDNGMLHRIRFQDGSELPRRAIFVTTGQVQRSRLPLELGCNFTQKGSVWTGQQQSTSVAGLFVAGDAARDVQFVVVAAAEGAKAGVAINKELQQEDRTRARSG
ncbi:MAG: NAD(P)/FAD-dependent oxidoreductase [Bryobacteraceae bacterium]